MAKVLTSAAVQKLKAHADKRREVRDAGTAGLYLVIQSSGAKSWALRFRKPDGKPGKLTLGPVDFSGRELTSEPVIGMPLSLPAARSLAAEIHRKRAMGRDVVADIKTEKHHRRSAIEESSANSFGLLARRYIKEHAVRRTRRWRETARVLGLRYSSADAEPRVISKGLIDLWGDRPVDAITDRDVRDIIYRSQHVATPGAKKLRRREKQSDAAGRRMVRTLSKLFKWLIEDGKIAASPVANVPSPKPAKPRERVLSDDEIRKFWKAAGEQRAEVSAPLKLLLLTGCRVNEIAGLRRTELSEDAINLPGARTKNHRPHVVPLARIASDLIPQNGSGEHVFSTTMGRRPIELGTKVKRGLDALMAIEPWTLHDLRRTCATGMAKLRVAPHVIEAVLNHVSGAKAGVAGIYNVYQCTDEKKVALERWAAHVEGIVSDSPAKVTSMTRRVS